jgi:hypothetical protein
VAEALPEAEDLLPEDAHPSLKALDTFFVHKVVLPRLGLDDGAVRYVHSLARRRSRSPMPAAAWRCCCARRR